MDNGQFSLAWVIGRTHRSAPTGGGVSGSEVGEPLLAGLGEGP